MYISTLFTSSVILNRWWLNSITGHIQIYVGIAAVTPPVFSNVLNIQLTSNDTVNPSLVFN